MIVPKTKDGRVVFMLPWLEATIAGTTGMHNCSKFNAAAVLSLLETSANFVRFTNGLF